MNHHFSTTNTTEHVCRFTHLETVMQQRFKDAHRIDDKIYAIMQCVDCGRVTKEEL